MEDESYSGPETAEGAEPMDEGKSENFFIPADALEGHECKAGDKLTFTVVGKDSEGGVEVSMDGPIKEPPREDFAGGMRKAMGGSLMEGGR